MAELALAVVSLTFQVFSGCMKGYQLLSDARELPSDYQYVRVRLKTQQFRLLDWAQAVCLTDSEDKSSFGRVSKAMLLDVLEQQQALLFKFGRYEERFAPFSKKLLCEEDPTAKGRGAVGEPETEEQADCQAQFPRSHELLDRALGYINSTRKMPARLRWVAMDKGRIDNLLVKLETLNNFLRELLNSNQAEQLLNYQMRTNFEIMQLNSSLGQLLQILEAGGTGPALSPRTDSGMATVTACLAACGVRSLGDGASPRGDLEASEMQLESLATAKALNVAIHQGSLNEALAQSLGIPSTADSRASVELQSSHLRFDDIDGSFESLEVRRTEGLLSDARSQSRKRVWIEWKVLGFPLAESTPSPHAKQGLLLKQSNKDPRMERRLSALVTLLRDEKRASFFGAARCLGFFCPPSTSELPIPRCGLVFQKPEGVQLDASPVSLLELLREKPVPSLTQRAGLARALAESLERLHAVDWLHKGIRSFNVLFFYDTNGSGTGEKFDLRRPLLAGFDFSRPDAEISCSEKPPSNPAHDIYRHPDVQADSGYDLDDMTEPFRKRYDIYSLGIVLLEIALWRRIDDIMKVNLETAALKDTKPVRRRLLLEEPAHLELVRGHFGDVMHDVIRACLVGQSAFGLSDLDNETDPEAAARLQTGFSRVAVDKLRLIHV